MSYIKPHVKCDNPGCSSTTPAEEGKYTPSSDAGWLAVWWWEKEAGILTYRGRDYCSPGCAMTALNNPLVMVGRAEYLAAKDVR